MGITVANLDTVTSFFVGLGFETEGRTVVEGKFLDTASEYRTLVARSPCFGRRTEERD